jgi:general secretion pathway protein J
MSMSSHRHRRARGFTLIELLVGLSLMALMSIFLFGGFHFGLRAWEVGGTRVQQMNDAELAQNLLHRLLSQAYLETIPDPSDPQASLSTFRGTARELVFVAPLPAHRGIEGQYAFTLASEPDGRAAQLVLKWQLYRADGTISGTEALADSAEILENVASIRFAYFGQVTRDRPPQWMETWDGALGLPRLIALHVTFPGDDPRIWPDLIVAPKLQGQAPEAQ